MVFCVNIIHSDVGKSYIMLETDLCKDNDGNSFILCQCSTRVFKAP